jgi:two-component system, OmpR family, phosphate regulon response regulator PhoB
MPTNVLIVESAQDVAESICEKLKQAGLSPLVASDAETGWQLMSAVLPDVVLLNWILTNQSGASFANQLRFNSATRNIPIVMLGSRSNKRRDANRLYDELVMDANGYVTHPQRLDEVIAAVVAVMRQRQIPRLTDDAISLGGLTLDPSTRQVYVNRNGAQTVLTVGPTELRLLYFLMTHPNRVFSRTQLRDEVWGERIFANDRTVDTYVKRLRASLRLGACDSMIEAVHGVGYRLVSRDATKPASAIKI